MPTRSPSTARPWARMSASAQSSGSRRDPALRQAAEGEGRLQGAARQPVRFRDHEDQRDLGGIPQALSVQSEGPERLRGPRGRVRRAGGLPPPHRRSVARHRREHDAVHPRHRADRLSGRRRGREHAAAGGADQTRHHRRCPASATAGSPARRARRRSSTPRRKRRRAAGSRCSRPATACASTSTRAPRIS